MKPFSLERIENMLKNYLLGNICHRPHIDKMTSQYTYGKTIIVCGKDFGELEGWAVSVKGTKDRNPYILAEKIRQKVIAFEQKKFDEVSYGDRVTCCELCDWKWLENDDGHILRQTYSDNGMSFEATLVKYAKCIPDSEIVKAKKELEK